MPLHVNSPFTLVLRKTEPLIDGKQSADPDSARRMYTRIKDTGAQRTEMDSFPLIIRKTRTPVSVAARLAESSITRRTDSELQCPWLGGGAFRSQAMFVRFRR